MHTVSCSRSQQMPFPETSVTKVIAKPLLDDRMHLSQHHRKSLLLNHRVFAVVPLICLLATSAPAATRTWDGGGADGFWTSATNWVGDVAPLPGDNLVF